MGEGATNLGVVFIHGLFSSEETWDPLAGLLESDEELAHVAVRRFGYATPKFRFRPDRRTPDYNDLADRLKTFLHYEAAGHDRLFLVAHSQGGLIVQRYLARMIHSGQGQQLAKIRGVVLFACPNSGSDFAMPLRSAWWSKNPQVRALGPLNAEVRDAQQTVLGQIVYAKGVGTSSCPIPFWVFGGEEDKVVVRASAQGNFPKVFMLPGDHFSIIQAKTREHSAYVALRTHLLEVEQPDPENPGAAASNSSSATQPEPRARPGRLLSSGLDPFALEVRRAIDSPPGDKADVLPTYVPRAHDQHLADVVAAAAIEGRSGIALLVGGSSTGKTRACWEALAALREAGGWRVWHPVDPNPETMLSELPVLAPRTVLWLNESERFLLTPGTAVGERVAAALRTLLADQDRGPFLILGTIWPRYWAELTALPSPPPGPDPHAHARYLLAGNEIRVPAAFTNIDLDRLRTKAVGDSRLQQAASHSAGQVTQYLTGVPELIRLFRHAPPVAAALIQAAMDARRLGHPHDLPHDLLVHTTAGYLDDLTWHQTSADWFDQALSFTSAPCHGLPGPLGPVRPRPGSTPGWKGIHYRLSDYLEQTGRIERAGIVPPPAFWEAVAATLTDPAVLTVIGDQARMRCRFQHAVKLYRAAARLGSIDALVAEATIKEQAGDRVAAEELFRAAAEHDHPVALRRLGRLHENRDDLQRARELYRRAAKQGDEQAVDLLGSLDWRSGISSPESNIILAAHHGETYALEEWVSYWTSLGNEELVELSIKRLDEWLSGDGWRPKGPEIAGRVCKLEKAGDRAAAEAAARAAAADGDTIGLSDLTKLRHEAGDHEGASVLAVEATTYGDRHTLVNYALRLEQEGEPARSQALCVVALNHGCGEYAHDHLVGILERSGDSVGAERLRSFGLTDDEIPAQELA
ncbi:alpha/beta fold hydrolase [Streptomyces sp. NBC_00988]|uniref:alpha/beta fold hydrolase n=1 Tax=Streptomyces sp. NBC_00988 TaxID=2903704 RepID=UPI00386D09ED|nr:alpha/beta fold hydrolase [Streptomyces sp. NBC_00988]